jgi:hypothetical protein
MAVVFSTASLVFPLVVALSCQTTPKTQRSFSHIVGVVTLRFGFVFVA